LKGLKILNGIGRKKGRVENARELGERKTESEIRRGPAAAVEEGSDDVFRPPHATAMAGRDRSQAGNLNRLEGPSTKRPGC
jgi:hypothetical protein